jgi:alpha-N-arabinofuranosidase
MVNVLQAMILTEKDRMVLTPTYHVFDMYQPFMGATQIPVAVNGPAYAFGDRSVPAISASAGRGADGAVHVALVNLDPNAATTVSLTLRGVTGTKVSGRVLTSASMSAHNTFAAPQTIAPVTFNGATVRNGSLTATIPAKAVVVLTVR